jgi:hypothetical protein
VRDRVVGQLTQVVARLQDDWLDALLPTEFDQREPLGLAATGRRVDQQDR